MVKWIGTSEWADILYRSFVFFAVFDGMRAWMVTIGPQLTFMKELIIAILLLILIYKHFNGIGRRELFESNVFLIVYLALWGSVIIGINNLPTNAVPSIYRSDMPSSYVMHYKTIECFLMVLVMLNYERLTGKRMESLMRFFVVLCVSYVLVTLFVFYVYNPFSLFQAHWYGRISIGYPTADTQVLCFALAFVVFIRSDRPLVKVGYLLILILGIIMNATNTGIASMVAIFVGYFLFSILSGNASRFFKWRNLAFVVVLVIIGNWFYSRTENKLGLVYTMLEVKMNTVANMLTGGSNEGIFASAGMDPSMGIREHEMQGAFELKNDPVSMTFGGPISVGTLIENENGFLIRSYGYVGIILYYLWAIWVFVFGIRHIKSRYGTLLVASFGLVFISNVSLISTYMFGLWASFSLIIGFCLTAIHKKREEVLVHL